ncbi:hypothetical protein OsJ_19705 [Oryza sativa Japonica Group]|uniref:Uncharacterized protein n=1 Tax=Oryza sativa subsp. japonica TaxID=39947 RepID=B9FLT9_ORYSJ|nr:hypothetical protein OsJ_19705 [Oryza sativa Japonica Group]
MGRTWPVGTASGIGAIAGGAATDWIGASSSMDGFGRIRSDGRGRINERDACGDFINLKDLLAQSSKMLIGPAQSSKMLIGVGWSSSSVPKSRGAEEKEQATTTMAINKERRQRKM